MNKNTIVVLVVLVLIILIAWYAGFWGSSSDSDILPSGDIVDNVLDENDSVSGFAKLGSDAIYVTEQRPGKDLVINIVNMASPGYVVIHESKDGVPGAVIGNSALIESTESKNIKVTLSRPAKDGEELIAMLHTEKSVVGFDPAVDLPVRDASNNIIHMIFQVSNDASDPSTSEVRF